MTKFAYDYERHYQEKPERDLKYFEAKFEARIEDSKEYKHYTRRMPYYMWDGKLPIDAEVQVIAMKAIHLSSDNLERLVREQEVIDRLTADAEFGKRLWRKESIDLAVREANPSVEKAYQKYIMLLELARK
jgi:hypothetical protein